MARVQLEGCDEIFLMGERLTAEEQPAALRGVLPALAPLHPPNMALVLEDFRVTPALAERALPAVAAAGWRKLSLEHPTLTDPLPAPLPQLQSLVIPTLDDTRLGYIQQCVPAIARLYAEAVRLQTPVPRSSRLPKGNSA